MSSEIDRDEIRARAQRLEEAATLLRSTFVGIDRIIDDLIEPFASGT